MSPGLKMITRKMNEHERERGGGSSSTVKKLKLLEIQPSLGEVIGSIEVDECSYALMPYVYILQWKTLELVAITCIIVIIYITDYSTSIQTYILGSVQTRKLQRRAT